MRTRTLITALITCLTAAVAFAGRSKGPIKYQVIPPDIQVKAEGGAGIVIEADRNLDGFTATFIQLEEGVPASYAIGVVVEDGTIQYRGLQMHPEYPVGESFNGSFGPIDQTAGVIIYGASVSDFFFSEFQ